MVVEHFRRLLGYLKPYRQRVILAVVLLIGTTLTPIAIPRIIGYAVDVPLAQKDTRGLAIVAWGIVLFYLVRVVISFALNYLVNWLGQRIVFDLRYHSYRHLNRLSLAYYDTRQTGKIMARLTGDIDTVQHTISGGFVTFLADLFSVLALVVVLFYFDWRLALVSLSIIPLYVLNYKLFIRHIRPLSIQLRERWDAMLGVLQEKLAGITVVKAFVREKEETERFMETVRDNFALGMKQMILNRMLGTIAQIIRAVGTGAVLWVGGNLILQRQMQIGELLSFNGWIAFLYDPAVRLVDFNVTLQWAGAALDRIFETLDTRPEIVDAPDAVALPSLQGAITLQNVSFSYGSGNPVLQDINLKVNPGEVIAIVGQSGAGKTTLVNLIARFYDVTEGAILVDGVDVRKVKLEVVRSQIGTVSQESLLFSVTLKENIRYGSRDATDIQIFQAARSADIHSYIMNLPQGYDTKIGEDGIKLSVGQKQRMSIARAVLTDPRILILDDATSALDSKTEANVQQALERVMQGRTCFVIAHRLSTIMHADKIVVMDGGKIVDTGTHAELVARPGVYQNLYNEQFRSAKEQALAELLG